MDVTYTYEVKGEKYTNNQRKLGYVQGNKTFIPKLFAMMKLEKYKGGKKVKVFYYPSNPNNSILERGILPFTFSMMVVVAVLLFFMGLFGIPTMIYSFLFP